MLDVYKRQVFEYTIREVPRILKDYIARENKKIGEYDYYVMHQANQYILQQLSKRVKLDPKKMLYSIQDYGCLLYTSRCV